MTQRQKREDVFTNFTEFEPLAFQAAKILYDGSYFPPLPAMPDSTLIPKDALSPKLVAELAELRSDSTEGSFPKRIFAGAELALRQLSNKNRDALVQGGPVEQTISLIEEVDRVLAD